MECILVLLYQWILSSASSRASRRVAKVRPARRATFSEPNSVSAQALSQQFPLRLMEGTMPKLSSIRRKLSLAYWLPRSPGNISSWPFVNLRRYQAISSAFLTISACMSGRSDQPTILRLNTSTTTARQSQPSSVPM